MCRSAFPATYKTLQVWVSGILILSLFLSMNSPAAHPLSTQRHRLSNPASVLHGHNVWVGNCPLGNTGRQVPELAEFSHGQ